MVAAEGPAQAPGLTVATGRTPQRVRLRQVAGMAGLGVLVELELPGLFLAAAAAAALASMTPLKAKQVVMADTAR